jgi:hypothetical protein
MRKEKGLAVLVNDIKKSYERRISALQTEMSDSVNEAERNREAQVGQLNESAVPHKTTISNVKKILRYMDLLRMDNTPWSPAVYTYSNYDENGKYISVKRKITFDPICTILSDEYNALMLYIVPNKKPVNKFSLVIRGYSIFAKMDLFRARYGSISGIHDLECNIYATVKDASTEKELLAYVESSMEKIKTSIPKECIEFATEYEDAKEKFQDPRWQLFYWEYQKENYEKHVSSGTSDPEYSKILGRIRELKKLTRN